MIRIGEEIKAILGGNKEITEIVGRAIYPLVFKYDSKLPCIVYKRNRLTPSGIKDRRTYEPSIEILCVSENYDEGLELAAEVLKALDGYKDGDNIQQIRFTDGDEYYQDDRYV